MDKKDLHWIPEVPVSVASPPLWKVPASECLPSPISQFRLLTGRSPYRLSASAVKTGGTAGPPFNPAWALDIAFAIRCGQLDPTRRR